MGSRSVQQRLFPSSRRSNSTAQETALDSWLHNLSGGQAHLQHLCQPEWDNLGHPQPQALIEDDIEVDVNQLPCAAVQQDVVQVAVPEPKQPAYLQTSLRLRLDADSRGRQGCSKL